MTFEEWKAACRLTNEHPATLMLLETCWEAAQMAASVETGLRRAGELLWENEHYDAAALIREELNRIMRGTADVPVNAYDED